VKPFQNPEVERVFATYPSKIRTKLLELRALIFDTAASIESVGVLEETLKWGEPAYVTSRSRSGSTLRIAWKRSAPKQYAMYFHCQTNLVDTFRDLFPDGFAFEGNRALIFQEDAVVPIEALRHCVEMALTYHLRGKSARIARVTKC
jgi:Domain of unknown function (DU1801)